MNKIQPIINPEDKSISDNDSEILIAIPSAFSREDDKSEKNLIIDVQPLKAVSEEWYYLNGTEVIGPFAENELSTLVKSGVLNQDTLVWNSSFDKDDEWKRAGATKLNSLFK